MRKFTVLRGTYTQYDADGNAHVFREGDVIELPAESVDAWGPNNFESLEAATEDAEDAEDDEPSTL